MKSRGPESNQIPRIDTNRFKAAQVKLRKKQLRGIDMICLRLVFTSDGVVVGIVDGVVRELTT